MKPRGRGLVNRDNFGYGNAEVSVKYGEGSKGVNYELGMEV